MSKIVKCHAGTVDLNVDKKEAEPHSWAKQITWSR